MTRYAQIMQRAFNTPLLVEPAKAQAFLVGLGARVLGGQLVLPSFDGDSGRLERAGRVGPRMSILEGDVGRRRRERGASLYPVVGGIAVIDVTGTMVHRGSWIGESSGATSYEGLMAQFDAVESDPAALGVAVEIDTYGGEVSGCFDLADRIRQLRAKKPVWAFVAESAFSAGYAIASQADRIILPRTGEVGSIGVLSMHVDYSQQLADEGVAVTLIHAGSHKVDGNPFEPLPEEVRAEWQDRADHLRNLFAETVAAGRGSRLSAQAAMATEARCFMGAEAVAAGLADEVSDLRAAFAAFGAQVNGRAPAIVLGAVAGADAKETIMSNPANPGTTAETTAPAEEEVTTALPTETVEEPPANPAPDEASVSIPVAQATALAEVAAQASALGVKVDLAAAFKAGTSADALRASVMSQLAAKSDQTAVTVTHPVKTSGESPIVAAAKKSAAAQVAAQTARN
ncbi:MAG TPA: S49 family peptidase [Novosphingobium sp.]|jgi:signal peptide peptidase SppA|nr:S49 family peptidase [Novosphingobium sp.]